MSLLVVLVLTTAAILYTAPTSKAELGNHPRHLKVCSAHQSPKSELRCGKTLLHIHSCRAHWIKHHTSITSGVSGNNVRVPLTSKWRSHLKFHLWMVRRARGWITQAHHRLINNVFVTGDVPQLICHIFREACSMALRVASRESGYSIYAQNGQYEGMFQMGNNERSMFATIGYSTAYEQIVAAHNYYLVSGWSPWSQTAY